MAMKITQGTLNGSGNLNNLGGTNSVSEQELMTSPIVVGLEEEYTTSNTPEHTTMKPSMTEGVDFEFSDLKEVMILGTFEDLISGNIYYPVNTGAYYEMCERSETFTNVPTANEELSTVAMRKDIEAVLDVNGIGLVGTFDGLTEVTMYEPAEINIKSYKIFEEYGAETSNNPTILDINIEVTSYQPVVLPLNLSSAILFAGKNIYTGSTYTLADRADTSSSILDVDYAKFRFDPPAIRTMVQGFLAPATISGTYTAASGITYHYRSRFKRGIDDLNHVTCITQWSVDETLDRQWSVRERTIAVSEYSEAQEILSVIGNTEVTALKNHLDTVIGPIEVPETRIVEFTTSNGDKYNYKIEYIVSNYTAYESTSATVTVRVTYGQNGVFDKVLSNTELALDPASYSTFDVDIADIGTDQIEDVEETLDKLIGEVTVPETISRTITTASGKKFYVRVVYSRQSSSDTEYVMNYVTSYGPTINYGTTYSAKTHTITSDNYNTREADLLEKANTEIDACVTDSFAIWNVPVPQDKTEVYTNQGGLTYYIRVQYYQGETTESTNTIEYVTTWGQSAGTDTANEYSALNYIIKRSNVSNASASLDQLGQDQINAIKDTLDIPDIVCPASTTKSHTVNGFSYTLLIAHTKGTQINVVNTALYIDGSQYGSTISNSFFTTQEDADEELTALVAGKMRELEVACNASPANYSTTYNKGGCNYTIATQYSKSAGSKTVTVRTLCDGEVYRVRTWTVDARTFAADLEACSTSVGAGDLDALRTALSEGPSNGTETVTINGLNFSVSKEYTKAAGNATMSFVIKVDGVSADTGSVNIDPADIESSFGDVNDVVGSKVTAITTAIDTATDSLDISSTVVTKNGFSFRLGGGVSKTAGSTTASSYAVLDGETYGASSYPFSYTNLASNVSSLNSNISTRKNTLATIIDAVPANASRVYTKNGLSYRVGTQYSKSADTNSVSIQTILDGKTNLSQIKELAASTLSTDVQSCISMAGNGESQLIGILDGSPEDNDTAVHQVGNFVYYCGAKYVKVEDSQVVTVKIMLDGVVSETYTNNITNITTAQDIIDLKSTAANKIATLVASLQGLDTTLVEYTVGGFGFNLTATYTKDTTNGTVTIRGFIDDTEYGTATVADFDATQMASYENIGKAKIDSLKTVVGGVPSNTVQLFTVNGFNFNVGVSYSKEKGSDVINIYRMLDGNTTGTPVSMRFESNNIPAIGAKGTGELSNLKAILATCPADYVRPYAVGQMMFNVGSTFSKIAGSSIVAINTTLDGDVYGGPKNISFDIGNIPGLLTEAAAKEDVLKTVLNQAPIDNTITHTVNRCSFDITKSYSKTAGSKNVTTLVKLDGVQYDQIHQEVYNILNLASLTGYNDTLSNQLVTKLNSIIPDDIHETYTRNGFNFTIDAMFSKTSGSDVVTITYLIDSANITSSNTSTSSLLNG